MTAPTLPEPRPDDEGRETAVVTDDDVRRAVCDYNDWKYDEMMSSVSLRDTRSLALRVVLESFAARSAPLGATDEGLREAAIVTAARRFFDRYVNERASDHGFPWMPTDLLTALVEDYDARAALQARG